MGLFDQILSAIDNPELQASAGQLGGIVNTVQGLGNSQGANADTTQEAMALVGKHVRSALQSNGEAQSLVNQFSGTGANPEAVNALFSEGQQQQMVQDISQRTGLDKNMILGLLPILVPLVLNLLNSGSANKDPRQGGNSVLNAFLDSDRDGDVDISDALRMASKFLG